MMFSFFINNWIVSVVAPTAVVTFPASTTSGSLPPTAIKISEFDCNVPPKLLKDTVALVPLPLNVPCTLCLVTNLGGSAGVESNKDLIIEGKVIPAGKYGFFVIPSHKSWTIIFNKKWDQHGKDEYNENDDVHRFEVIPNNLDVVKDHLEYEISKKSEASGIISLAWEKIEIQLEFEIKK